MHENDIIELNIEDFTGEGMGVAHLNGMTVFVQGGCPGDFVAAKITKVKKNFATAIVKNILNPSKHRVKPFCPMQNICGACSMQFIDYDYQLELKRKIVQNALLKVGGINFDVPIPVKSPEKFSYRHKIQYSVSRTKVSKRLLIGYYKPNSHEVVNIKHCPIQPEICDKIIEYIREKAPDYNITGYSENEHNGLLRHIILRVSKHTGQVFVALVINDNKITPELKKFATSVKEKFTEVTGISANFNTKQTNVILGEKTQNIVGMDFVVDKLLENTFKIGTNTFFQVNPETAENIFTYIKDYIKLNFDKPTILDAYAGIAAIGMSVVDVAQNVVSVELSSESCQKALAGLNENKIKNLTVINSDTEKYLKKIKRKFDLIITDPPKKGSTKNVLEGFMKSCKDTIIYVSCNPATLARDLKYLIEKGCKLISIKPFDMFCHTHHVETVAIIKMPENTHSID